MSQRKEEFSDLLLKPPWWVSATLGVLAYVGLRWILPAFAGQDKLVQTFIAGLSPLAPFAALASGSWRWHRRYSAPSGGGSWTSSEASKRCVRLPGRTSNTWSPRPTAAEGLHVDYSLGKGSDGGVDLVLRKDGRKSWSNASSGKRPRSEGPCSADFGIMTAEGADDSDYVTSGGFTGEARASPVENQSASWPGQACLSW